MPQVCHAVDRMHDTRVLFICVTAAVPVSTVCVHVRHPAIPSQRARASSVGKTPSFSFCQVDMYIRIRDVVPVSAAVATRSRGDGRSMEDRRRKSVTIFFLIKCLILTTSVIPIFVDF